MGYTHTLYSFFHICYYYRDKNMVYQRYHISSIIIFPFHPHPLLPLRPFPSTAGITFSSPLNYISELNYISNKTERMTLVKIMDHKYVALPSEIYKFHLQIVLN